MPTFGRGWRITGVGRGGASWARAKAGDTSMGGCLRRIVRREDLNLCCRRRVAGRRFMGMWRWRWLSWRCGQLWAARYRKGAKGAEVCDETDLDYCGGYGVGDGGGWARSVDQFGYTHLLGRRSGSKRTPFEVPQKRYTPLPCGNGV